MNTGDQNIAHLNRIVGTLLAIIIVPVAYFMGVSEHEAPSILTVFMLVIGGYVGCLIIAFVLVKVFGKWLPDNG